jgi:hypothetical protein
MSMSTNPQPGTAASPFIPYYPLGATPTISCSSGGYKDTEDCDGLAAKALDQLGALANNLEAVTSQIEDILVLPKPQAQSSAGCANIPPPPPTLHGSLKNLYATLVYELDRLCRIRSLLVKQLGPNLKLE